MSLQDKFEILKSALHSALKVVDVIIKVIDTIIEKLGGNN